MNLIGLSGYAQSGKDTVAGILVKDYGYTRIAFADKIKELLYEINPYFGYHLKDAVDMGGGWDKVKQYPEVRKLLQDVGVAARTVFGEDFWVQRTLWPVLEKDKIIVTDVRFPNEMKAIWAQDGTIWRVEREGIGPVNDHVSEHATKDIDPDSYIFNNGTLKDLEKTVHNMMRHAATIRTNRT
jgi:hypothetical protein